MPTTNYGMTSITIIFCMAAAFGLDYASFGPDWREKLALLIAAPAIRAGWDGSAIDAGTVGIVRKILTAGLQSTGPVVLVTALVDAAIIIFVCAVAVWSLGMLMPAKASRRFGKFATLSLSGPNSGLKKINPKIWFCALILGTMSDLIPGGLIGDELRGVLDILTPMCGALPGIMVGVSG
jgi:hypothetical protein